MKLLAKNRKEFTRGIDPRHDAQKSIVLRYRNLFKFESQNKEDIRYKKLLEATSIKEGIRIFPLLEYHGVKIYILDETSRMHTNTLKSIDGCISSAKCRLKGYEKVVSESGGNTGMAMTAYGCRQGVEVFLFMPEDNLSLLNSKVFKSRKAHLISVKSPGMTKAAARLFRETNGGIQHIPQTAWRYEASMFRGMSILEYIFKEGQFDWLTQTISAAFGPIGIYRTLKHFNKEIAGIPRFLGIQQKANCPMFRSWKTGQEELKAVNITSTKQLLTRVMYDVKPHTYQTYKDLLDVLKISRGELTTISRLEFNAFLGSRFGRKGALGLLKGKGINITVKNSNILEKTGLIALAGTLKHINSGKIAAGSKVLCCLTSGISQADGQAKPEYQISRLSEVKGYSQSVFGKVK